MMKFLLIVGVIGSFSACGQKGPLVLPVKPPAVSTPYPKATPKENIPATGSTVEELSEPN